MRNSAKRDDARRCLPRLRTLMLLAVAMLPALGHAQNAGVSVPLMLAPDSERQGFVRIINESDQTGSVRITAHDDAGTAASPIEIRLEAGKSFHFNSEDLADGNAAKGIGGIGQPSQGHWRLSVETALQDVQVLAFVRTRDGFLTAMHDVLPRDAQGRLVAKMLNPGGNRNQESKLRLVNTGANRESVSISGVDDQGASAGPVRLTLNAGQSRTLSAYELENGASGLTGTLGEGAGKWRLLVTAGQSVVGMGLLETAVGPSGYDPYLILVRPCGAGACTHSLFMPSKGTGPAPSVCRLPVAAVEQRLTLTADQHKQLAIAYMRAKGMRAKAKTFKAEAEAACKDADQLERQADEMRKELELQGPQAA